MARAYQKRLRKRETKDLRKFFARHTELFLPFLELIERSSSAITDVLESVNYAVVEALLELSATKVAGPVHQAGLGVRSGGTVIRGASWLFGIGSSG
jgi:hypothetical protein